MALRSVLLLSLVAAAAAQDGTCEQDEVGLLQKSKHAQLLEAGGSEEAGDESSATGNCLTGSACSSASQTENVDGTTYCCPSNDVDSTMNIGVPGSALCTCSGSGGEEAGDGGSAAASTSTSSSPSSSSSSSTANGNCLKGSACSSSSSSQEQDGTKYCCAGGGTPMINEFAGMVNCVC
jgi:hypothetical protein